MKLFNLRTLALTTAVAATAFFAVENAQAQTQNFTVSVEVANDVTFTNVVNMDFGQLIAVTATGEQATIALGSDGTLGAPANGTTALFAAAGGTPAAASVDIQGVSGQDINLTIDNVNNPDCSGSGNLELSAFQLDFASGGDTSMTVGASQAFTLTAGPDAIAIGATLSTPDQAGALTSGACTGGDFDLIAAY